MGPSISDVSHLGGGGSAKRWHYSINLISKMSDKGEGGVKNLKTWVTSFMDGPLASVVFEHVIKKDVTTTFWIQFQSSV